MDALRSSLQSAGCRTVGSKGGGLTGRAYADPAPAARAGRRLQIDRPPPLAAIAADAEVRLHDRGKSRADALFFHLNTVGADPVMAGPAGPHGGAPLRRQLPVMVDVFRAPTWPEFLQIHAWCLPRPLSGGCPALIPRN